MIKHNDQKQFGEEKDYLSLHFMVHHEGRQSKESRRMEIGTEGLTKEETD